MDEMGSDATLIGLVRRYSPSGSEHEAAHWLVERMRQLHFTQSFVDETGNAIGVMGNGPKQVILLGHIDTVPGEIPVRVDEEILYGRGSVDAKGPLACFTDAAARVGPVDGWQIIVIGAVEEERDSKGARAIVHQYKPDYCIAGEPNQWNRIALGYKGSAWAELMVKVAQTHSASKQESACDVAFNLWQTIKAYADEFNKEKDKLFHQLLLSLDEIESNGDGFEQFAALRFGARLPPEISPEMWYSELEKLCFGHPIKRASYPVPAWQSDKNTSIVRAFLSAVRSVGGTPGFVYKTGTSDINVVSLAWNCPAVVYGPGDSAFDHTPDEQIHLDEYRKAVQVLSVVLQRLTLSQSVDV
jgi:[amino group carrier protein]-lysine/ornithine hydrolase